MPLKLYRRHGKDCEASFPEGVFTGEYEEGRRGAKRCSCTIHASGTLAGKFNRKRTGCFKWDDARAITAQWEAAGSSQRRKEVGSFASICLCVSPLEVATFLGCQANSYFIEQCFVECAKLAVCCRNPLWNVQQAPV